MIGTPRVDVLTAWEAGLRLMTGTRPWGGTYPNAPVVEREYKSIAQVTQMPHLCVLSFPGSTTKRATQERYDDWFRAAIVAYVQGTATMPAAALVEHLTRDCKMTLLTVTSPSLIGIDAFEDEDVEFYESGHAALILPFTAHLEDALS